MKCKKCNSESLVMRPNAKNPSATELICGDCGTWQKFVGKEEIRLFEIKNQPLKPKPTNADKIRSMTDEDLARNNVRKRKGYVTWTTSDGREFSSYLFGCTYRPDEETIALAIQHELNWLRQPCGGVEND
jgi:hypothetical protein